MKQIPIYHAYDKRPNRINRKEYSWYNEDRMYVKWVDVKDIIASHIKQHTLPGSETASGQSPKLPSWKECLANVNPEMIMRKSQEVDLFEFYMLIKSLGNFG